MLKGNYTDRELKIDLRVSPDKMDSPVQSERDITKIGLKPNVLRPKLHAKIALKWGNRKY